MAVSFIAFAEMLSSVCCRPILDITTISRLLFITISYHAIIHMAGWDTRWMGSLLYVVMGVSVISTMGRGSMYVESDNGEECVCIISHAKADAEDYRCIHL